MNDIIVEFDKVVCEGKTLGRYNGKVVFAYGVLPGEKAKIQKTVEKRNFIEGEVLEIISQSQDRISPKENHFLSCSPWQIINYDKQIEYKKNIILEGIYQSTKEVLTISGFFEAQNIFGYRTKIEYSFLKDDKIYLAFHRRGNYSEKIILNNGCALINEKANLIALEIVKKLNQMNFEYQLLKTLIVRYSFASDSVITALFIKDKNINPNIELVSKNHIGHINVYSKPESSISSIDGIISVVGTDEIFEVIDSKKFFYSFDCFFQNNIFLFDKAINIIKQNIAGFDRVVDLYCGIGVIGLCMMNCCRSVIGIESVGNAVKYAKKNAQSMGVEDRVKFIEQLSEDIDINLIKDSCLIVDPPRAGMHKNLIKKILLSLPSRIIYLSCNPITQGRDLGWLLSKYRIVNLYGFDFYPNTPHIETLIILDRK